MTTTREVFYGVISQGVTPYFFIMNDKICSFFGHRDVEITEKLYDITYVEILNAIELGCRTFYFGGYGDFDGLCYDIVTRIKNQRNDLDIKRVYCVSQEKYLYKNVRYFKRENYDDVIYLMPSFDGWYKSIYFRNCAMIDKSDVVIFYAEEREDSGAYKTYKYARTKKNSHIVNIFDRI